MKKCPHIIILTLLLLATTGWTAMAGNWPKIAAALQRWQGPKELLLRSTEADPLASAPVREVLELALEQGYAVRLKEQGTGPGAALILELRSEGVRQQAVLTRAGDGAFLALERHPADPPPVVVAPATVATAHAAVAVPPAPIAAAPPVPATIPDPGDLAPGPVALRDRPRSLALLGGGTATGVELLLQTDEGLQRVRLHGIDLQPLGRTALPAGGLRALYLDGRKGESTQTTTLLGVWAEDRRGIYEGTDSWPHSWLMEMDGENLALHAGPPKAFVRLAGDQGQMQARGTHSLLAGPVFPVALDAQTWRQETTPLPWAKGNLFDTTPINDRHGLRWRPDGSLQLVDMATGQPVTGGTLLQDLGEFHGPRLAVRLANPEYRSGMGKEDVVRERWQALPPRIAVQADGSAFTIQRGRSAGLPLLGKPSGQDRLVLLAWSGQRLIMQQPFAGVDAHILDFALVTDGDRVTAAVLLLNERPDGSGQAYLQWVPHR
jgi:hypothetical protein